MAARILVIEDDPNILLSVEFLLTNAGHGVVTAADGLKGWAALQRQPADLVILDVMLPGVDGFEICRRIRAQSTLNAAKVLMLSARGEPADAEKCLKLGANAYLRKPFATRDLIATVSRLLS